MKEEARPWIQEQFKQEGLGSDITRQVEDAVVVIRIYEDYMKKFEPLSLREASESHLVAQRLDTWLEA